LNEFLTTLEDRSPEPPKTQILQQGQVSVGADAPNQSWKSQAAAFSGNQQLQLLGQSEALTIPPEAKQLVPVLQGH